MSGQILEAVAALTKLVEHQQHRQGNWGCQCLQPDETSQISPPITSPAVGNGLRQTLNRGTVSFLDAVSNADPERNPILPLKPQGVESILGWSVFDTKLTSGGLLGDINKMIIPFHAVPSIEYQELTRLEAKYILGIHLKNPVVDLTELHQLILEVSENGLDWSTKTCLVALVCAIGAITQLYPNDVTSPAFAPTPRSRQSTSNYDSEAELSIQYWGVAVKRLGLAIGQNNLEAVQCLCLAG